MNRQKARESQSLSNSFATRTVLKSHQPVESSGNSHQLSSKKGAGNDAREPQAGKPALPLLTHRVRNRASSFRLAVRGLTPQKENQCQES